VGESSCIFSEMCLSSFAQWDESLQSPLIIGKDSTRTSIEDSIRIILAPPFPNGREYPYHDGATSQLSQDQERQVEGEAQILVREER
jgi:hypothetical protein